MSLDKFNTTPSPLQVVEKVNDVIDALATGSFMKGATATENGEAGFVPAPIAGDENKMLHGDGSWKNDIVVKTLKTVSGIEIY